MELPLSRFYHPIPSAPNSSSSRNITYQVLDKTQLKDLTQEPAGEGVGLIAGHQPPLDREKGQTSSTPALTMPPAQPTPLAPGGSLPALGWCMVSIAAP